MIFNENELQTPNRQITQNDINTNYLAPKDKKVVRRIPSPKGFCNSLENNQSDTHTIFPSFQLAGICKELQFSPNKDMQFTNDFS